MQNQISTARIITRPDISTPIVKPLQLIGAFLLGTVILYAAGFVNTSAVHNAAHDTRHSQGFPCH